jgi:hypothetical protein
MKYKELKAKATLPSWKLGAPPLNPAPDVRPFSPSEVLIVGLMLRKGSSSAQMLTNLLNNVLANNELVCVDTLSEFKLP